MLNLKKVTGSKPVKYEKLRGGTFMNVLEKEVEIEDGTQWEYWQMFTTETDEVRLGVLADKIVKQVKETEKSDVLSKLTVTTKSGKVFYADTESRVDLESAIASGIRNGITSTLWKLAEEFQGNRFVEVSAEELQEASMLALTAKGSIVGVL